MEITLIYILIPLFVLMAGGCYLAYRITKINSDYRRAVGERRRRMRPIPIPYRPSGRRPSFEHIVEGIASSGNDFGTIYKKQLEREKDKEKKMLEHMEMMRKKKVEKKEQKKKEYTDGRSSRLAKAALMMDEKEGEEKRRKKNAKE